MISKLNKDELLYYAPPGGSGLATEWTDFTGGRQGRYLDYCRKGHDIIADTIVKGMEDGAVPSMKALYGQAAHIRRAIAELSAFPQNSFEQYGQPVTDKVGHLTDFLTTDAGSRYELFMPQVKRRFANFASFISSGRAQDELGENYSAQFKSDGDTSLIAVMHRDANMPVALITQRAETGLVTFEHAHRSDRDTLFALADDRLTPFTKSRPDPEEFWKCMAEVSLHLFHAAPLRLGSQTTSLMVLAGLTKAMGYEIVPRKHATDHFIEAELTPYKSYIAEYESRFERKPGRREPNEITVDNTFIQEAMAESRIRYAHLTRPEERLEQYCTNALNLNNVSLSDFKIADGAMRFKVSPETLQEPLENAFIFIGHQNLADMLGLEKKKMPVSLLERVSKKASISATQDM